MLSEKELFQLHTNQKLLVAEMQKRGIHVEIFDRADEILIAHFEGHTELFLDRESSINPYAATIIAGNKFYTKRLLERVGINTPTGQRFYTTRNTDAVNYAISIGFPVVIKPCFGSHGDSVYPNINNQDQLIDSIHRVAHEMGAEKYFLIERHISGKEYRIFCTREGQYAALYREAASVLGNGKDDIKTLILTENHTRTTPRKNCLCPLRMDENTQVLLAEQGVNYDFVPAEGQKIFLTKNSNMATGGMCTDVTGQVHPGYIQIAMKSLSILPGLPFAGIDLICDDILQEPNKKNYSILEVNSNPGIHMHHAPGVGSTQNVASLIVDLIFPETKSI